MKHVRQAFFICICFILLVFVGMLYAVDKLGDKGYLFVSHSLYSIAENTHLAYKETQQDFEELHTNLSASLSGILSHVTETASKLSKVNLVFELPKLKLPNFTTPVFVEDIAASFNRINPGAGNNLSTLKPEETSQEELKKLVKDVIAKSEPPTPAPPPPIEKKYDVEENEFTTEAILVPNTSVVISSSMEGKIEEIPFKNGDYFKKGDVLIRYNCGALEAESRMAQATEDLVEAQAESNYKLFNLDMISRVEMETSLSEQRRLEAQTALYESRFEDCRIRANFDGRVTNRLANAGEYTRTDRVLMEVASSEPLNAEMIVPSTWLRWVDVGAPVTIQIGETLQQYEAKINRIYGEVDPVTQTIQIVAQLEPYQDRLLPGMSGEAVFNVGLIRESGVKGYLEKTASQSRAGP